MFEKFYKQMEFIKSENITAKIRSKKEALKRYIKNGSKMGNHVQAYNLDAQQPFWLIFVFDMNNKGNFMSAPKAAPSILSIYRVNG